MVILLDAYHLGDPLFLAGFTRDVQHRDQSAPHLFVHGGGEAAERALEARGEPVNRAGGTLVVQSAAAAAVVERAARELGREITAALNESGVPAVRFTGADRQLLTVADDEITASPDWLLALARSGAVPVVTALRTGGPGGALVEVPAGEAAAAIAQKTGLPLGILGASEGAGEREQAARSARRRGVHVVEKARSGWIRGAGMTG